MGRKLIAIVIGLAAWVAVASIGLRMLRAAWPAYAAAEPVFHFDFDMMAARLAAAGFASIVAAALTAVIARGSRGTAIVGGLVLLAGFVPVHIGLWDKFPVWYHLTFLASLPALALVGALMVANRA